MFSRMLQESFKVSISDVGREGGGEIKRDNHKRAVFALLLDDCHRQQEKGQTGEEEAQVQQRISLIE